jgi:hypothetical protein
MKALTLALVVMVSACQAPAGTQFRATVVQPDGSYAMPVVLGDQTGLVTAIEAAPGDGGSERPSVQPDPDDPNAVIVSWGTGACDDDTAVALRRSGAGFRMDIVVHEGLNLGCTAQLLFRGLRVRFSESVPDDAIDVFGGL